MTQIVQNPSIGRGSPVASNGDDEMCVGVSTAVTPLGYSRCISRELVHRASISEVFITDIKSSKQDLFSLAFQWPRGHSFYRDSSRSVDSAVLVESVRQSTIALAHAAYGVSFEQSFLMTAMAVDLLPMEAANGAGAVEVYAECRIVDMHRRTNGQPRSFATELRFYREGTQVGRGKGEAQLVNKSTYQRLRKNVTITEFHSAVPRLRAGEVGHNLQSNSILSPTGIANEWTLALDTSHPVYFDHFVDHVPGVVLLEAIRQGVRSVTRTPLGDATRVRSTFHQIVDLDRTTKVIVKSSDALTPLPQDVYTGLIIQDGIVAADCELTFSSPS